MSKLEHIKEARRDVIKDYSSKLNVNTNQNQNILNVKIHDIIVETPDTKSFILVPNKEKGTLSLPTFKAGAYISLKLNIDDAYVTRAYSLSSGPKEALKGFYRITIKRVEDGFVSNYILDNIKVGDNLTISEPLGDFCYNSIRDEENVIGIAGGSGITPFISMAKAILSNDEDFNLTVFYSVKTEKDIIFKKEIDNFNKKNSKIKFIITLTREENSKYNHGYINKEMIESYIKEFNTVFMCGPKALYKTINDILLEYNIPKKCVHYENFAVSYEPKEIKEYKLKILMKGTAKSITCKTNETLLVSMEKAGIEAPSLCRVGSCGFCRSILIDGKIKMIGATQNKDLSENDYIHPCVTYPESDIVIKLDI